MGTNNTKIQKQELRQSYDTRLAELESIRKNLTIIEIDIVKCTERIAKVEESATSLSHNIENIIFDVNAFVRIHADTVSAISYRLERIEKCLTIFTKRLDFIVAAAESQESDKQHKKLYAK